MLGKTLIIILGLFIVSFFSLQKDRELETEIIKDFKVDTNQFIIWNIRRKLHRNDFTNKIIPCEEQHDALLSISPRILTKITQNKVLIAASIFKREMYSYYTTKNCDYIYPSENTRKIGVKLHEQLHFDLYEVKARYIRKEFINYLNVIRDSSDAYIILCRLNYKKMENEHNILDDYTRIYGPIYAYAKFRPWINQKLKELEEYKNPVIYFKSSSNSKRKLSNNK